jgi:hypothetical protein
MVILWTGVSADGLLDLVALTSWMAGRFTGPGRAAEPEAV